MRMHTIRHLRTHTNTCLARACVFIEDMDVDEDYDPNEDPDSLPGTTPTKTRPPSCAPGPVGGTLKSKVSEAALLSIDPGPNLCQRRAVRLVLACLEELRLLHIQEVS